MRASCGRIGLRFVRGIAWHIVAAIGMRFLLPSLLLLCTVGPATRQAQTKPASTFHRVNHQKPGKQHDDAVEGEPATAPPLVAVTNLEENQKTAPENNSGEKKRTYWEKVTAPEVFPNWILMGVGFFGTLAAFLTLKVIYNQARDARDQARDARADSQKAIELTQILAESARTSAKAGEKIAEAAANNAEIARQNTDSVMRRERAWILIEREISQDKIQDPYLPTVEQFMVEQRMPHCIFFYRNVGRTAAKIVGGKAELQLGKNPSVLPNASIYDMKDMFTFPDILPPGNSSADEATFRNLSGLQDLIGIKEGIKFLWLCGIIKYVDTFERGSESEHETRFCYLWETRMNTPKPFWRIAGPTEYNKAT